MAPVKNFGKRSHVAGRRAEAAVAPTNKSLPLVITGAVFVVIAGAAFLALRPPAGSTTAEPVRPQMFVIVDRATRHTCPAETCGDVGDIFFRQKVEVYESKDGWVRIAQPYDASCVNGRSENVESMNDQCNSGNGITDGQLAEWVRAELLSSDAPADPADGLSGVAAAMARSDDYSTHGVRFEEAAEKLVQAGLCSEDQLAESGGWSSSMNYSPRPVYFIFCGETRRWVDMSDMSIIKSEG